MPASRRLTLDTSRPGLPVGVGRVERIALTISEEFALLALDEDKGTTYQRVGTALPFALAGTLLLDLHASGAVAIDDTLHVTPSADPPMEPLLIDAWRSIQNNDKARDMKHWVARPTRLVKGLPGVVYDRLVARGVLAAEGRSTILRRARYSDIDTGAERDVVASLAAILDGDRDADEGELLLLALLPVCKLTNVVFPERDRRATNKRIEALQAGAPAADEAAKAVSRAVAAQIAAIVAASVAASSAASG